MAFNYYWRARANDPNGSGKWGPWSETRQFSLSSASNLEGESDIQPVDTSITIGLSQQITGDSDIRVESVEIPRSNKKTYMYKVYDKDWNFLGIWDDVVSDFGYSHEINSAGSAIDVTLARNSDSISASYDVIADDNGDPIITDDNNEIAAEVDTTNSIGAGTTVDLNLNVRIYEFSDDNQDVAGELVFTGYISKYVSKYGSEENTTVSIFSYGADLDNWVYELPDGETRIPFYTEDPSQILRDALDEFNSQGGIPSYTLGTPVYSYVKNMISNPSVETSTLGWTVYNGIGSRVTGVSAPQGSYAYKLQNAGGGMASYSFGNLMVPGRQYTFSYYARRTGGTTQIIGSNFGAEVFTNSSVATSWTRYSHTFLALHSSDLMIMLVQSSSDTYVEIDGLMLTEGPTLYDYFDGSTAPAGDFTYSWDSTANVSTSTRAELLGYEAGSIESTMTNVSYEFNVNTGLDVVKSCLKLAPTDWYWYYDMAQNLVHFHPRSTTPTHKFFLGKHILGLNLEKYIEDLTNTVYYIGGDIDDPDEEKLSFQYLQSASSTADATSYTYSSQNLGPVAKNKAIIVVSYARSSASTLNATSITVGGVPAEIVAQSFNTIPGSMNHITVAIARVPELTTGDVVTTYDQTLVRSAVSLYRAVGLRTTQPFDIKSSTATNPSVSVNVPGQGFVIGAGVSQNAASATWTNLTENYDQIIETATNFSTASTDVNLGRPITATYTPSTSTQAVGLFVSFRLVEEPETKLYGKYEDSASVNTWRRGTKIMSDERVKIPSSMQLIAETEIDRGKNPRYRSSITISNGVYPIKTIKLGDLIGFRNFGNFIDTVEMQVVRIDRKPDSVTLQLDTLLPTVPKRLEDLKRNLDQSEASYVPDAPST